MQLGLELDLRWVGDVALVELDDGTACSRTPSRRRSRAVDLSPEMNELSPARETC